MLSLKRTASSKVHQDKLASQAKRTPPPSRSRPNTSCGHHDGAEPSECVTIETHSVCFVLILYDVVTHYTF